MIILNVFIPKRILSGNKFNNRRGWKQQFLYKSYRREWYLALNVFCHKCPYCINLIIHGLYIRYIPKGSRPYDEDNCKGGTKAIRDCLKRGTIKRPGLGWLREDNRTWHEYECIEINKPGFETGGTHIILATNRYDIKQFKMSEGIKNE